MVPGTMVRAANPAADRIKAPQVLAQLAPTAFREGNRLFTEFKGALTENYVLNIPPVYGQSGEPADGACTEPAKQEYKQL